MIKCDTTLGLKDSSTYADQLIWYTTWIEWNIKIMIISIDAKKNWQNSTSFLTEWVQKEYTSA